MALQALEIGKPGPAFELPGIDGKKHSLESLKGEKATVVVFSCNHCPYVIAYEDRLIALAHEFKPQGVSFVFINANDAERYPADSFDKMKEHATEKGYPFPYLHDARQDVAVAYGAAHTPEVYVLDGAGRLAYHGRVDDNVKEPEKVTQRELHDALSALVAGRPVKNPKTFAVGCTIKWKPGKID